MTMKWIAAVSLLALAGCQSSRLSPTPPPAPPVVQPNEPLVWGRQDCKRASTNPEIQDHFARTKSYCEQEAGIAQGDSVNPPLVRCMKQRGYNYGSRTEHDMACSARAALRR